MARLKIPNSASLHTLYSFLRQRRFFTMEPGPAVLEFHREWLHMEPIALAMTAAWGAWWRAQGKDIAVRNSSGSTGLDRKMGVVKC